jgi:hypothetical protein
LNAAEINAPNAGTAWVGLFGELQDRLAIQEITIQSAEADAQAAKLDREAAELARIEYTQGLFRKDLVTVEGEIKQADANLIRAEDAVEWVRRIFEKS